MDFTRLKYIKNVTDWHGQWGYKNYPKNSYFKLNFHTSQESENKHSDRLS
ncbi:MAG: hypothetical protein AB4062_09255 [Crocosphaera sp.]